MKESLILECKNCHATHLLRPPRGKLKKTTVIELNCMRCGYKNDYRFIYSLKEFESRNGILTERTRK